jgi:hypothetical protein
MRDIPLADISVTEVENALAEFKREVAAGTGVGAVPGRLLANPAVLVVLDDRQMLHHVAWRNIGEFVPAG